jgi:REP element-mobilizing transposase RayT
MKLFATKHSHAVLYLHLVWSTKNRAAVLDRALLLRLAAYVSNQERHHSRGTIWPEVEPED